ncbi:hypothetical protein Y032_0323g2482 [Ancylostoma ceylanicum]|uniref:Uncharacterized protein n=1 Tax=Ancylostoma ceylanicum TaxID=53326 RepID=A0A016S0F4_9BILA|nr:hypothetical protein Y032_0323g2482 [Ancylostoma ceylanicum]
MSGIPTSESPDIPVFFGLPSSDFREMAKKPEVFGSLGLTKIAFYLKGRGPPHIVFELLTYCKPPRCAVSGNVLEMSQNGL